MRYLLLLLPLIAVGCTQNHDAYGTAYGGYGGGYDRQYPTGDYYGRDPSGQYRVYSSGYGYNQSDYGQPYYGGENCGTPYEPAACPPMPRVPLDYYPDDR